MTYEEKEQIWEDFCEQYTKGIADTVFSISSGKDEVWDYGSLKYSELDRVIESRVNKFISLNPKIDISGLKIHLIYLPFSVDPLHIQTILTAEQVSNLSAFGVDLMSTVANATVKELRTHITEKFEKLSHSNGFTFRTFDHSFDNNWKETLKNTPEIGYVDSNNQ